MAASSSTLGRMSLCFIKSHLATIGLAGRNDAAAGVPLDKHDDMQPSIERSHRDQAGLAMVSPSILENQGARPVQFAEVAKIGAVTGDIRQALFSSHASTHFCNGGNSLGQYLMW
jgi:hypothetical protein